jgi:hypothetical protein
VTQLDDLVAPELEAHRIGHAEAVDVEDAAAHRELRHVVDHLDALEADALEMRGQLLGPADVALPQLEACLAQRARQAGALEHRARRGEQDAHGPARQPLERLDPLTRDLRVRLGLAEALTVRVERHRRRGARRGRLEQRAEVGEPALGLRDARGEDDEQALRVLAREGREQDRVARARKAADGELLLRAGEVLREARIGRKGGDRVEEGRQGHGSDRDRDRVGAGGTHPSTPRPRGQPLGSQHHKRRPEQKPPHRPPAAAAERPRARGRAVGHDGHVTPCGAHPPLAAAYPRAQRILTQPCHVQFLYVRIHHQRAHRGRVAQPKVHAHDRRHREDCPPAIGSVRPSGVRSAVTPEGTATRARARPCARRPRGCSRRAARAPSQGT